MTRRRRIWRRIVRHIRARLGPNPRLRLRLKLQLLFPALIALAPTARHRAAAVQLRSAWRERQLRDADRMAYLMLQGPDLRAEKMVSHRYRCLWICNPKVASRSIREALREIDPDIEYLEEKQLSDIFEGDPRVRDYFTFAFVRHPYPRAHSFYVDKYLNKPDEHRFFIDPYPGASSGNDFDRVCEWLNTTWGSDAFADRHWLSQHCQIRLPDGRLPDFIGRHENMGADWRTVLEILGMPEQELPVLNTRVGWKPAPEEVAAARRDADSHFHSRNREQLRRRYADDFEILGYSPEEIP